jgi:hypothetical protein
MNSDGNAQIVYLISAWFLSILAFLLGFIQFKSSPSLFLASLSYFRFMAILSWLSSVLTKKIGFEYSRSAILEAIYCSWLSFA